MPTTQRQRRHFVLAHSLTVAKPIMDTLRKNGLRSNNIIYLTSQTQLDGIDPKDACFIYGPSYLYSRCWNSQMRNRIYNLIEQGATVKPVPVRPEPKPEPKPEPIRPTARPTLSLAPSRRPFFSLSDSFGTALSSVSGGPNGTLASAPLDKDKLVEQLKSYAAGDKPTETAEPKPTPEPVYKEIFLGGPKHGQRKTDPNGPFGTYFVHTEPPQGFRLISSLSGINRSSASTTYPTKYRRQEVEIFGAKVNFWIAEDLWNDRNQLMRDFVLFQLEV
ncbi:MULTISPECIES: hypothetical protein [Streptosporangium]|uniref:Uncharacterized protein n=1 Tax=Streptosporangium brasiliense TaxID=47480 RepID=A0ABT9RM34_9ACTN|nr:hypothetical protein [Streptosporangium brasiliense]MDP9870358.1 hypothetical protein [Streptosporangium brasiliense]